MITLEQAKSLKLGTYLGIEGQKDKYGNPRKWKVNGKVKLWKRNPERIEIPVKYGLYNFDYITEEILHLVSIL